MTMLQGKWVFVALSAVLALVGAWGFSVPQPQGLAEENKTVTAVSLTQDKSCVCGTKSGKACCSAGGDQCCCSTKDRANSSTTGLEVLVLAQAAKEDMKASPEAMAKGEAARKAIEDHRKALAKDGVHSCCIKPSCTFCSTAADMCPCAMNVQKGGPVCPECWGGWMAGQGRLEGIDPSKVQVIPKSKLKMMYEMKAKNFEKAAGVSGQK